MTKFEVIDRKLQKYAKKWQNPGYRGKKSQILNSTGGAGTNTH